MLGFVKPIKVIKEMLEHNLLNFKKLIIVLTFTFIINYNLLFSVVKVWQGHSSFNYKKFINTNFHIKFTLIKTYFKILLYNFLYIYK